jgi:ribosome-associated translation inhibitor RaiA
MKLPLQVTFRDMVPPPSLEPEILRRAAKLDLWTPDVMSCHVVVEAEGNRHRTGQEVAVRASVRVPDEVIVAGEHRRDEDVLVALHSCFDALGRQLEDYARRRRGQTKQHAVVLHGRIESLSDDGVGHIVSDADDEYRFDRTQVEHPAFEQLSIGQEVRFLEGSTRTGREARRVFAAAD